MNLSRRHWQVPVLAVLLAGCATQPEPGTEETIAAALPETTEVPAAFRSASDSAVETVQGGWLQSFSREAPELESLVAEALANNLNLAAAAARVDAAAGVVVMNTPLGNAITTAEHAIELFQPGPDPHGGISVHIVIRFRSPFLR